MNEAFKDASTLSFVSQFEKEALGVSRIACTYRVWLKKPNLFRVEVGSDAGNPDGVMIGDGTSLWIYWPTGRPRFQLIRESDAQESTRVISFMKKPAGNAAQISIWHELPLLGNGAGFPIVDVSIFHGHVDSLSNHIDSVRGLGSEAVAGHVCKKIEVSMLDHQRSQYLWLSKQDRFPRRLVELVRVDHDVITREVWSSVKVDQNIPDSLFHWRPPHGWQEWKLPRDQDYWPPIGSNSPAFDLASIEGDRIRLSDYRGKVVWLNFWRIGCPPCVVELPKLQAFHSKFKDAGLEIIGVNVSDDVKHLRRLLDKVGITYSNILDTSDRARKVYDSDFGVGAIPLNCIIGRDGTIVDMWVGYSKRRATKSLREAGLKIPPQSKEGG